ncbi:MAG: hypothetical protein NXY57DRAFT_1060900 [Lentinula lateritia]|nr:MAG: hypothetical protein NXY57DRAFT_1060900 [Lentinula lateritia]
MVQALADVDPSSEGDRILHRSHLSNRLSLTEFSVVVSFGPELKAFNALQLLGLIGSIFVLVTALFSSVPRQATWYNFFISWTVFCASYLLLFFDGHAYDGDPELSLCIAQSSLTYAASPFSAACSLAMVIQLYINIQTSLTGRSVRGKQYWRIVLMITPYVIFTALIIESLSLSLSTPNAKFSAVSYCSLENHIPGRITAALVVILTVPMLVLNLLIYLSFRKHWTFLQKGNYTSMFVRVSAFTLFGLASVIVGLLFFLIAFIGARSSNKGLVELDIVLSMMPVAAVVVFGSHKDLLDVCLFWRKHDGPQISGAKAEKSLPPVPRVHVEYHVDIIE